MRKRIIPKKAAAILASVALALTTAQIITTLVPAQAGVLTPTERAAIPRNYGPIGDNVNDPWTTNFPRSADTYHRARLSNNRIALVFDFEDGYTWETMGGIYYKHNDPSLPDRNYDQANKIMDMFEHLRGAPVSVGVYTFHRARQGKQARNNTPNLRATSLENHEGYAKVMAKMGTLDATDGTGHKPYYGSGSNMWWGLKQVYDDMTNFEDEFKSHYGVKPEQPLYNIVFLFTVGNAEYFGPNDVKNPTRARNDARTMALNIFNKGAHIRVMGMGPNSYRNRTARDFLDILAYRTNGSVTSIHHVAGGYEDDSYHFWDPDTSVMYRSPEERARIKQRCNDYDPYEQVFPPNDMQGQICNQVRDGKFANTVEDYMFTDPGLEITADAVNEDLTFLHPIGSTNFKLDINNGTIESHTTGSDGIIEKRTESINALKIAPRPNTDQYALTRLRLQNGSYSQDKIPSEGNARCVGFSRRVYPTTFTPTDDPNTPGGIVIESAKLREYTYIKCGFYHRPMQEAMLRKSVKVGNEQIRFDVLKSKFNIDWSCRDPYAIEDPDATFTQGSKELVLAKQNPGDPDITLNTEYSFPDMPIGTPGTDNVKRMPVGAVCQLQNSVKYPHRCYGRHQSATCRDGDEWKPADWDNLMTVSDSLQDSEYFEVTQSTSATPKTGYDYGFEASGEHLTKPEFAAPDEKSILETLTTFTSKKASVKVRVNFTNSRNDPAYSTITKPDFVPVYYNCRYMGDPTRPPEIPESNAAAMPGYVELGAVDVPTNGTDFYELGIRRDPNTHEAILDSNGKTIPTWPVGTHCLFTSLPPKDAPGTAQTNPWSVPGFNITDSYSSDVCAGRWNQHDTTENACTNNYFWVHSGGQKSISLNQNLVRKNAQITFTKTLTGNALNVGRAQTFTEALSCTQNGVDIPSVADFTAKADIPKTITVPAAAKCTISESLPLGIPLNVTMTLAPNKTFGPIIDTSSPLPVTTNTEVNYKTATKQVQHTTEFDHTLTDPNLQNLQNLQNELRALTKKVTATCTKPEVAEPEVIERNIVGDATVDLGVLPIGTTCTFTTEVQGLEALATQEDPNNTGHLLYPEAYRVIPTTTVDAASTSVTVGGTVAKITTRYKLQTAGAITLHTESGDTLPYASLKTLLPGSYQYQIDCGTGQQPYSVTLNREGGNAEISNATQIPANAQCTLTQVTNDNAKLARNTTMTPSIGQSASQSSSEGGGKPRPALHLARNAKHLEYQRC